MKVSLDHVAGLAAAILFMIRQNADTFSRSGPRQARPGTHPSIQPAQPG
jgi:hypothetical protein